MALSFEGKENATLEDLKWKNRIVIYFPTSGKDPKFELDSIEEKLKERKIIFYLSVMFFTQILNLISLRIISGPFKKNIRPRKIKDIGY